MRSKFVLSVEHVEQSRFCCLINMHPQKILPLICYYTHYKMAIYHELTSEQVSMGSECEVGSACYSKHDWGEIASGNRKWQKK
jgi:hypothetical protein